MFESGTGVANGVGFGSAYAVIYGACGLTLWYGSKLIREDDGYTPGKMLAVSTSMQ